MNYLSYGRIVCLSLMQMFSSIYTAILRKREKISLMFLLKFLTACGFLITLL